MKIALVYVLPVIKSYEGFARRFVQKYCEHPPGTTDHQLFVVLNGGIGATEHQRSLFHPLVPEFIYHDNSGRDIGAYQVAAQTIHCDLMFCIGTPVRPCAAGWLDWSVKAVQDNGPGLYGPWAFHVPEPHVRTTMFWTQPEIINAYPTPVSNDKRYAFEFGRESITRFCQKLGLPTLQVTAYGVFSPKQWHFVERDESIFIDQHGDKLGFKD